MAEFLVTQPATFFKLGWIFIFSRIRRSQNSLFACGVSYLLHVSSPSTLFVCFSMVFAAFTAASCLHGTTLYKRTLAKRAQIKPFGYTNRLSAINWANLDPDYSACALGMDKSSINLDNSTAFATEISQIDIPIAQTVSLLNIGTTLEVVFVNGSGGTTTFQNQTFNLIQCHFHTPSEHRFNEEFFPAEMHMVQENIGSSTPVFALTFR